MEAYLDNSATTRVDAQVQELMKKLMDVDFGNPSSRHQKGVVAEGYIKEARQKIAATLKVDPKELIITSGGTESNNMALIGTALAAKRKGNHIITTAVEHPSVKATASFLEEQGFRITFLSVDSRGQISLEELKEALTPDTILVSIMTANNEIGTIEPIKELGRVAHEHGVLFHTDAVQAVGHIPISVKNDNIDMLSLSAHKFHGPKGIGVLYAKKGVRLTSLIAGGAQERGKRAGTENIPAILGMAAALQDACDHMEENTHHCLELRERLIAGLSKIPHSVLNGDREHRLPSNVHFCFEGIEGESLLLLLDQKGICASSGSACTSGSLEPSHVLLAIGRPHEIAHGSMRLSLGEENTMAEVDYMLQAIPEVVAYLRHMSPVWRDLESGKKSFLL